MKIWLLVHELKEHFSDSQTEGFSRKHVSTLDGLRGIAILMVLGIYFGYSGAIPAPPPRLMSLLHVLAFGWMGVDLFFVLSGFLITGILLDTIGAPNFFKSFYARRTLRIFPLYYLVVITIVCASSIALRFPLLDAYVPDSSLIANVFYVQNWWMGFHGVKAATVLGTTGASAWRSSST